MGQKVSPLLLRIGYIENWRSLWYADKKDYANWPPGEVSKTQIVAEQTDASGFLGCRFVNLRRPPRRMILDKFKAAIRSKTKPTSGDSLSCIVANLNPLRRGSFVNFQHGHRNVG